MDSSYQDFTVDSPNIPLTTKKGEAHIGMIRQAAKIVDAAGRTS